MPEPGVLDAGAVLLGGVALDERVDDLDRPDGVELRLVLDRARLGLEDARRGYERHRLVRVRRIRDELGSATIGPGLSVTFVRRIVIVPSPWLLIAAPPPPA